MGKKLIIVVLVIVAGLMLGITLSGSLSDIKLGNPLYSKPSQETGLKKTLSTGLEVRLTASPSAIKAAGTIDPVKELGKIQKSNLTITYANSSTTNLSGVELWIITEGGNSTGVVTMSEQTKYDSTKSKNNAMVFNLSDLPKKSSNKVVVGFFVRPVGDTIVKAELRSKEGKTAVSESKIIKSN